MSQVGVILPYGDRWGGTSEHLRVAPVEFGSIIWRIPLRFSRHAGSETRRAWNDGAVRLDGRGSWRHMAVIRVEVLALSS
jgi:hypothetical protein